jgi:hypothetical protein
MLHPLDGAKLKVIWAQEHFDTLSQEILRYLDVYPHVVGLKKGDDSQWRASASVRRPDDRLSAIIGDCLHSLACALDYVMWEVAGTYSGRVLVAAPPWRDKPYFPLWDEPGDFQKYIRRLNDPNAWNYKIPNPVIAEFEQVQPYHTRYARLGLFRILVNIDKHRLPLVTKGELSGGRFSIDFPSDINPQLAITEAEAKVQAQTTVHVTWQDSAMPREPVQRTIEDFVKLVANIIPRFERFVF